MDVHIRLEDLRAFARGELPTGEVRIVVAHLLSGCAACKALASDVFGGRLYCGAGRAGGPGRGSADGPDLSVFARARALVARAGGSVGACGPGVDREDEAAKLREVLAVLGRSWNLERAIETDALSTALRQRVGDRWRKARG